ncbi:hypothetical protein FA04_13850 [Ensifer adhaerens]|uniref:Uncharacterized protein n=1 Tax=Ensifer adhaerens TaxID=106592 RepID=A0ABY8HCK0_ENSAD|nr:hypothetical protein [Ensifer adhaerens]ANK73607.1 hypothetical protein FA04_13850 [Ensifer adhaerens]KDP73633.1 hypothetical protein FA04_11050 [Ensifer adhaerens]WFP89683.1 hypothetical protein P4B07_14075 [Ensifer adhaerens]
MIRRPEIFARMGSKFAKAFGNVDAVFTIAGVVSPKAVRGILRVWRDVELMEEVDQAVEGTTHLLAVAATDVPGLESRRDTVAIDGVTYPIINVSDDARAMLKLSLSGDI